MKPTDFSDFLRRDFKRLLALFFSLLLGVFIGALVLPYMMAGEIYEYQDTFDGVHLPSVDVIVCLAGGRGRIVAAGDLWYRYREARQGSAPVLYVSGVGPKSNWTSFLKRLRSGVRDVIQPVDVVLERESYNTETNALWFARYAKERGWHRFLLITSPYHMRRAQLIFQEILAQSAGQSRQAFHVETLSVFQEPFEPSEWRSSPHGVYVTLLEYIKWVYYKYFWHPRFGPEGFGPLPQAPAVPLLLDPAPPKPAVIKTGG